MVSVKQSISDVNIEDQNFIGTIAFRSENFSLPDGSKMALGIDDGRWVLIHEKREKGAIVCYEYNSHDRRLLVDKKLGSKEDLDIMKRLISYFFESADIEDLVTILPPKVFI
jgi:hypothetical protein